MTAPVLQIPDITKHFTMLVAERKGLAAGVLTQTSGSWAHPLPYFCEQLDPVTQGWTACLRAAAAVVLLLEAAEHLTFGVPIVVETPHSIPELLASKGGPLAHEQLPSKVQNSPP